MYGNILHSKLQRGYMKKDTARNQKERLKEAVEALTEENRRHFLGVLEALKFAQAEQGKGREGEDKELPVYPV
jgi:hypothetical protein